MESDLGDGGTKRVIPGPPPLGHVWDDTGAEPDRGWTG